MLGLLQFVILASATALSSASSLYSIKESIEPPRGWAKHSQPHPDHKIVLRIGLPQPNFNELERHLYEVSDPDHHRYGQHLSKEEVEALVAPHQESIDSVGKWLDSFGITDEEIVRSPAKDWMTLTIPISMAEKMLETVRLWLSCGFADNDEDLVEISCLEALS